MRHSRNCADTGNSQSVPSSNLKALEKYRINFGLLAWRFVTDELEWICKEATCVQKSRCIPIDTTSYVRRLKSSPVFSRLLLRTQTVTAPFISFKHNCIWHLKYVTGCHVSNCLSLSFHAIDIEYTCLF